MAQEVTGWLGLKNLAEFEPCTVGERVNARGREIFNRELMYNEGILKGCYWRLTQDQGRRLECSSRTLVVNIQGIFDEDIKQVCCRETLDDPT